VHAGRIDPCAGECVTSRGFCKGDGLPCVVLGTFTEGMTPKQLVDRDDQVAPTYSSRVDELFPAFAAARERGKDELRLFGTE